MTFQERLTQLPPLDRKNVTRIGVVFVGIVAILFGINAWYNATHLRLTGTEPGNNTEVSKFTWIKFHFNKPISDESAKNLSISPYAPGRVEVIGKDIIFYPDEATNFLQLNTDYTVTLSNVQSIDGKYSLKDISLKFKTTLEGALSSDRNEQLVETHTDVKEAKQPVFEDVEAFLNYGVTSAQTESLITYLRKFKPEAERFSVSVSSISVNSEPGNFTADFKLIIDKSSYSAHMDYSGLDDVVLTLTDTSGKLVYNSATTAAQ